MAASPPSLPRLVIVGAAGHGLVVAEVATRAGGFELVGFLDSGKPPGPGPGRLPILGPLEAVAELAVVHRFTDCLVAVGHNAARRSCVERMAALAPGLRFPAVVHPTAVVAAGVVLGDGTVVMARAVVNPGCVLGRHCIVNTGSCLDHESRLDDFASLAPGVVTGGNVSIGARSAVCLGAQIIHGIRIGSDAVVGAGALVLHDVPDACVVYGRPARHIRSRTAVDRYM
jgi:sugar O-acyltransferase (sialic acid O-acetyltransferase NeuD family)